VAGSVHHYAPDGRADAHPAAAAGLAVFNVLVLFVADDANRSHRF
jgi:hypothetical protein